MEFDWDFGDGGFGTGSGLSHWYTEPGLYDVTLTMTSAEGCVNTETYDSYITIVNPPIAVFTYAPTDITVTNTRVHFTNESMYADSYTWTFGDGSPTTGVEYPEHEFPI